MKRIIALCIASNMAIAVHADEGADRQQLPVLERKSDAQIDQEREKFFEELRAKRENLNDLERLAVPVGTGRAPPREDVLLYRFDDVSRLQAMLRDPEWKNHWTPIAATIAMAADKKAALDLIEFVKNSKAPAGYEHDWNKARVDVITALGYTLIDQDIPEVLEFLEQLTDDSYAESLNFERGQTAHSAQSRAFSALAIAANDDAIAVLESALSNRKAEKEHKRVRALSVGEQPSEVTSEVTYDKTEDQISKLEMHLNDLERKRAGLGPEPSDERS